MAKKQTETKSKSAASVANVATETLREQLETAENTAQKLRDQIEKQRQKDSPTPKTLELFGLKLKLEWDYDVDDCSWSSGDWDVMKFSSGWSITRSDSAGDFVEFCGDGKTLETAKKNFRKAVAKAKAKMDALAATCEKE